LAGGRDAAKAKSELMNLKSHDPAKDGANEISALASKLKAKRALANPEEENKRIQEQAFKEEQVRIILAIHCERRGWQPNRRRKTRKRRGQKRRANNASKIDLKCGVDR